MATWRNSAGNMIYADMQDILREVKMKFNRKLCIVVALLMLISTAMAFGACSSDSEDTDVAEPDTEANEGVDNSLQEILDRGEFILGCDDEFPPMGFDDNGEIVGFDIDLATAVMERIGVSLTVKPIDWKAKEMELSSGNIDAIWNGYTITADRNEQVQFTKPYLSNEQMLVVKADSDITSKADLAGKVVGAQVESAAEDLVNEDEEFANSLSELRVYDSYQDALNDLKSSDRVAAVAVDKILIEWVMVQSPDTFKTLDESLGTEYFGIGLRKGSVALADAIDEALDDMKADGTTAEISSNWFGEDIVIRDVPRLTAADF